MAKLELTLVQSEMATVLAAEDCKTYMFPGTRLVFLTKARANVILSGVSIENSMEET